MLTAVENRFAGDPPLPAPLPQVAVFGGSHDILHHGARRVWQALG